MLSKEVKKAIEDEERETTGTLFLNVMDISHVPPEIERLVYVNKVDIFFLLLFQLFSSFSSFSSFSFFSSFSSFSSLHFLSHLSLFSQKIFLGSNRLRQFPEPILKLTNLVLLHLDCNSIDCLPSSISAFRHLVFLMLRHNR